jgi:Zn-dependent protease with chaperone function
MDLETFEQILSFLPPQVRSFVLALLALVAMIGIGLYFLKAVVIWALGEPQPTDPKWKLDVFSALKFLDAFQPAQFRALLELVRKEQVIRQLNAAASPVVTKSASIPPPPAAPAEPGAQS